MVFQDTNEDVVVFFDFENIVYSLRNTLGENPNFELLMDKCQEYGRIVLARAYADWSRHSTVIAPLQASGFDPVYVPTYFYENKERKARKNAVDIHIAIEAVEVMFTQPHINTFILLTGDKDFIPLANALRRNGKTVIAVGVQGTTSPYMRQATDDFVFYQQLLVEPIGKKRKPLQKDIYKILVDAVVKLKNENQKTVFPMVKHAMTEMLGSFNEKDYTDSKGANFNRFKDFILEAQRLGHVQLVTTGSVNEVLLPGDTPHKESFEEELIEEEMTPQSAPEVSKPLPAPVVSAPPPAPVVTDTESGFELLVWAVHQAGEEGKSLRISSIKTIMRRANSDFDEKQLEDINGKKFSKFSDFARAAARRGLVRIEGKGIRMEIHPDSGETPDDVEITASTSESISEEGQPPQDSDPVPEEAQPILESEPEPDEHAESEEPATSPDENADTADVPSDTLTAPPKEPYAYASDYRMRVLVVDALRNCVYPAPAHVIGKHCLEASEKRNIALPNRRLNQLLTSARDKGLLEESGDEAGIQEYTFVESPERIKLFLEDES